MLSISRRAVLGAGAFAPLLRAADTTPAGRARQMLSDLRTAQKAPGIAAAVWKGKSMVWSGQSGSSDLEDGAEVSSKTRFRIGSLSKLLTAAAAARLVELRLLDLDAPVQDYVPAFAPPKPGTVTGRMLLGHLAGVRHYGPDEYLNQRRYSSIEETLKVFRNSPLLHPPGSKYYYSSYGFNLLGAVLEAAATQDFLTLVRSRVCEPLHMNFTTADENEKVVAGRTRFYSLAGDQVINSPYTDLSDRWPSGGFLSTAEDLARFGAAHLTDGFLASDTLDRMFASQKTSDGAETGVGLAWRISMMANRRVYHHGGASIGGRAFLLLRPDDGAAVALLANLTSARFAEAQAMALADIFA